VVLASRVLCLESLQEKVTGGMSILILQLALLEFHDLVHDKFAVALS
jgi:hypothetical protein